MLSRLSQRERIMALVVAGLLPIVLFMFVFVYIGGKLSDRVDRLTALQDTERELQLKLAVARRAVNRGEVYKRESLPSDVHTADLKYHEWFGALAGDAFDEQAVNFSFGNLQPVKGYGSYDVVFYKQNFSISGTATLRQITGFLYGFYEARILHQIGSFSLTPEVEGTGSNTRLTGRLRFQISIDVVSLVDAPSDRELDGECREMLRTLDAYQDVVARRNLFGPPNVPPRLSTGSDLEFETGEDIEVALKARDANTGQRLAFELLERSSPQAELVAVDDDSATLRVPALPRGSHRFVARVTDDGWPGKSHDLELVLRVDDPQPEVISEPEPPPVYARYAFVSGITTNIQGQPVAWIRVPQPDDELHRLTAGQSFDLDERKWTVIDIRDDAVTIEVSGNRKTLQVRDTLDELSKQPPVGAAASK